MPMSANTTALHRDKKMPAPAARSAISCFFSPRERDSRALMPTAVPAPTAIIRLWSGKARLTAFKAFSLMRETNTLSTTLYRACTSMEIIMGTAMPASRRPTGMTPILFSWGAAPAAGVFSFISTVPFVLGSAEKGRGPKPRLFRGIYFFSSPVASWVR